MNTHPPTPHRFILNLHPSGTASLVDLEKQHLAPAATALLPLPNLTTILTPLFFAIT